MDDDKVFMGFALTLIAAITSVIAASVTVGFTTLPSPLTFIEHLSLSLLFRAAYKGIGGFDWARWSVAGEEIAAAELSAAPNIPAEATS